MPPHLLFSLFYTQLGLLFMSKPIEQVWGSKEYAKYVGICAVTSTTTTWLLISAVYFLTASDIAAMYATYGGFMGVLGGLLVGLKQVMPEMTVRFAGIIKFGISTVPLGEHACMYVCT